MADQPQPKFKGKLSLPFPPVKGVDVAKQLEGLYENNEKGRGGWYPVGLSQTWHSGIHLHATVGTPVRCIAPGRIVAARFVTQPDNVKYSFGSPCFVLVRHELRVFKDVKDASAKPEDRKGGTRTVVFYSLYMHLDTVRAMAVPVPWLQSFAPFVSEHPAPGSACYRINVAEDPAPQGEKLIGLYCRQEPTPAENGRFTRGEVVTTLQKGTIVQLLAGKKGNWQEVAAPSEGVASAWVYNKGKRLVELKDFSKQLGDIKAGKVLKLDVEVAGGEVIGHVGPMDWKRSQGGTVSWDRGVHLEVFSAENIIAEEDRKGWTLLDDDTDDDALCEYKALISKVKGDSLWQDFLDAIGWDTAHVFSPEQMRLYFASLKPADWQVLRKSITFSTSFWAVDWTQMVKQNEAWAEYYDFDADDQKTANGYMWWKDCEAAGIPLPARSGGKALVYHYHPLALMEYLDARLAPSGNEWVLGKLSAKYESNGNPGTVSSGVGDYGGVSYGAYQMASNMGVPKVFVSFLQKHGYKEYYEALKGKTPAQADFSNAWKDLAQKDKQGFLAAQHHFIQESHYEPARRSIEQQITGLKMADRSRVLNDVLWSASVQHGTKGGAKIFVRAFGGGDADDKTDAELIEAIYADRGAKNEEGNLKWFPSSSKKVQAGVAQRFAAEKKQALAELKSEQAKTGS